MNKIIIALACIILIASCKESSKIITTDDGYRYEVISKGSGAKAELGQFAYFDAKVTSLEGDIVFDTEESGQPGIMKLEQSSEQAPNPFADIFLGKNEGDVFHIYLGKGQGVEGSGHDSLIYKINFNELVDEETFNARMEEEQKKNQEKMIELQAQEPIVGEAVSEFYKSFKAGGMDDKIQTSDSGLKYVIQEEGEGDNYVAGDVANVYYYGVLSRTGEMFDNSYKRGQPFSFPIGQGRVIKGWDEGVTYLKKGSKAFFIIPSDLGYGERGSGKIKAGDELIFYIEVPK